MTAAIDALEADAAAWAVVPTLLRSYHEEPDAARLVLQQLGDAASAATADAILASLLAPGSIPGGGMGGGMGGLSGMGGGGATNTPSIPVHTGNEELMSLAIETVGRSTTQPGVALRLLQANFTGMERFNAQSLTVTKFQASLVAAIERLEARVDSATAP